MSETGMLRIAEAFAELDRKRAQGDNLGLVEKGYSRALRQAIETNDWLLEVEALKSIGDVNLEIGKKKNGDYRCFAYAVALYLAALLRCRDPFVWRTLDHRIFQTAKYIQLVLKKPRSYSDKARLWWDRDENENADTCMTKVGGILRGLDQRKRQGCHGDLLIEGYTMIMVDAIINMDTMVEMEALKSIGDIYLERGTARKSTKDISKASALYKSALKCYRNEASKMALEHRINCAEKAQREMGKDVQSPRENESKQHGKPPEVTRSYDEHHLAGDTALQNGDLDAAEKHFASALKQIHDRQSPRLRQEEECLRKLGNVYVQRGSQTKDGKDFAKATALYNASLARKGDKHSLIDSIKEAERLFLHHTIGIDCKPLPYATDIEHKKRLEEYRTEVKVRLEAIHDDHNPYQYAEDDPSVKQVEIKRAESTRDLFKDISKQRQNFVKDLVEECIKTIGPPPCEYAVVGLGSQATELVTPYSDLEFAILVEEDKDSPGNKEYFLNLTCYLYLKIINLGETILPAVAIKSLNDFHSGDPADSWFYDSVTPRGFAFDGAMPWASKTPFGMEGTETKPAVSLIQTPARMAEFQQHDIAVAHGDHWSDILRHVSYLTGEQTLVDDYMARVIQELETFNEQGNATVAVRFARAVLNYTIEQHRDQELGKLLDVKKEIYRFPSVAIVNLGLFWGVYATGVWDVIRDMEKGGLVTTENAHHLQVLAGISGELRLRTYVANGGQKENMSALSAMQPEQGELDETLFTSVFYLPDKKMLFRYYYTAFPLKNYILGITKGLTAEFIAALGYGTLYDASSAVKANIHFGLLQFKAAIEAALRELEKRGDTGSWAVGQWLNHVSTASLLGWIASSYSNLGDDRKAIDYFEQNLRAQQQMYGYDTKHENIALTYNNLGGAWGKLGDQKKSLQYHEQALAMWKALLGKDAMDSRIAGSLNNIGAEWLSLGSHDKAIRYFERGLHMLRAIHGANASNPKIVTSLANLGICWYSRDDFTKAITYHEQALDMEKTIYGRDTAHPKISKSLVNLGNVCARGLNDHARAVRYYEEAMRMNQVIYGNDTAHPDIALPLGNIGAIWRHLGDHKKAISYCEQALQMQKAIHGGDKASHPDIVLVLDTLGGIWSDVGDKEKALALHEEALKMNRELYGQTTAHHNTAVSLAKMGTTLEKFGDDFKAIRLYEEALKMTEEVLGGEHPDIASLLASLGLLWRNKREYKKSVRYCERALKINKAIHGQDAVHPSIAKSLSELAVGFQALGDYRKAMKLYEDALHMTKIVHGANKTHSGILTILNNLGAACNDCGDHKKAVTYHEQALALKKVVYKEGTPHEDIAMSLSNLGVAFSLLGDNRKAMTYFDEALEIRRALFGPDADHPDIASCLINLGAAWSGLGDDRKASLHYEKALKMLRTIYGADTAHPDIATTLKNMGNVCGNMGDDHKAMEYYKKTLKMMEEIHGNTSMYPDIASISFTLGTMCLGDGDYKNAISYHQRSLKIREFMYGHNTPNILLQRSLNSLGAAWEMAGNYRKAVDHYEKALQTAKAIYGENTAHPTICESLQNLATAWEHLGDEEKYSSYKKQADDIKEMLKKMGLW